MATTTVGVIRERAPGENRVSLTPDAITRLRASGIDVIVESSAGDRAWYGDDEYRKAEARVADDVAEVYEKADVIACVDPPDLDALRPGHVVVGMLSPRHRLDLVRAFAERGVTAVSLDMLPRTLSRAQSMDVLSSQANIAGYKAALVAADNYGRYFPMLTTAAGTSSPATVLVLGTGVAGLSAIGTARRLGAVVTAYDVRPAAKGEVESLGARFLELRSVASADGEGGYARELTADERAAQQRELNGHIGRFDIVITTAKVPGGRPPVLVTADALAGLRPGSVVVDMAAGPDGGNVEGSRPDETVDLDGGVRLVGAGNLASAMAPAASNAYGRNVSALIGHIVDESGIALDDSDEICAGVTVTKDGDVVHPAIARLLADATPKGDSE